MSDNNQDIFKMFEQAMAMSNLLNSNSSNQTQNNNDNMQKMKQLMEMMQFFNTQTPNENNKTPQQKNTHQPKNEHNTENIKDSQKHQKPNEMNTQIRPIFYDEEILTPELKSIKAAIPYLDIRYQKTIGVLIKFIEIQKLMENYGYRMLNINTENNKNWRKDMLLAIRVHMTEDKKNMIDMLIKFLDMKDIMLKMRSVTV